ncbi:MAG: ABC transporter ATP-binding protein [Acidobacteriota bacterium]
MNQTVGSPIVRATELVKVYGKNEREIRPLDRLNLLVPEGEFLALMGPSGSGKSTLLHILGGLDLPDEGRCQVRGVDLTALSERELSDFRASHVGFVFQSFNLLPVFSTRENVALPLRRMSLNRRRRREQVDAALDLMGLTDRANHMPSQLSGGQEQRVAIARALVIDPQIIIADEPTGDLDETAGWEIVEILRALSREHGKTIVMVTHDRAVASCADRILYFGHGRLHESEPQVSAGRQRTA